jgi:hypothetical protein
LIVHVPRTANVEGVGNLLHLAEARAGQAADVAVADPCRMLAFDHDGHA